MYPTTRPGFTDDDAGGGGENLEDGPQRPDFDAPAIGDLVRVTIFDTATQTDTESYGLVVDQADDGAVAVAWLREVSAPIPVGDPDPEQLKTRPDLPRVSRV